MKPCDDLDGALRRYNRENLEFRKRKDETSRTKKCDMMNNSRKKKLDHLDETKIRITLCVSFTNLIDDKQRIWHTTNSRRKD